MPQRPITSPFADAPLAKTTPGVIPPGARPKQRLNAALPDRSTPPRLSLPPTTPTVFPPPPKVTINPSTGERMALLHDLQRHRTIADEETQRQEKEKRDLTEKMERLRRLRREEEEKRERRARDEQVQRVARNEEELQRMREITAALEREEPPRDAPEEPEVVTIEDEMELGAESDGFTTVRNKKKKTPSKKTTFAPTMRSSAPSSGVPAPARGARQQKGVEVVRVESTPRLASGLRAPVVERRRRGAC